LLNYISRLHRNSGLKKNDNNKLYYNYWNSSN